MTHPDEHVQQSVLTRRRFLAAAGTGALGLTAAGFLLPRGGVQARSIPATVTMKLRLAASDTQDQAAAGGAAELLMFGFAAPPASATTIAPDHHRDQGQGAGPGADPGRSRRARVCNST